MVVPRGEAVNGVEFKNNLIIKKNNIEKILKISVSIGDFDPHILDNKNSDFSFSFFREHLRDCIFPKNLTIALNTLPFKRYYLCLITDCTYVLEEVLLHTVGTNNILRTSSVSSVPRAVWNDVIMATT